MVQPGVFIIIRHVGERGGGHLLEVAHLKVLSTGHLPDFILSPFIILLNPYVCPGYGVFPLQRGSDLPHRPHGWSSGAMVFSISFHR